MEFMATIELESDFSTLLVVLLLATLIVYRSSYIRNKQLGYFSWMQVFTLVIIPGFLFPLAYAYIQSILTLPRNPQAFIPDGLLVHLVLLSFLFTYGAVAIHEVAKLLSRPEYLRYETSKAAELNRFFHLTFSHNMMYSSTLLAIIGVILLEINHVPQQTTQTLGVAVLKGLGLGISFLGALLVYTRSHDEYSGRWNDLKWMFGLVWVGIVIVLYTIRRVNPVVTEYQLLLPALMSISLLAILSVGLVFRRLKKGGVTVLFDWEKIKDLVR
jgi:hypothetical protein